MSFLAWLRVRKNRRWLLRLSEAELLALIHQPDSGIDLEDADTLVKMAFHSFSNEEQRDALINRLATHLRR